MMLMRTDPFRDLDRWTQQVLGTAARPAVMPMDAWREGDQFIVELPARTTWHAATTVTATPQPCATCTTACSASSTTACKPTKPTTPSRHTDHPRHPHNAAA